MFSSLKNFISPSIRPDDNKKSTLSAPLELLLPKFLYFPLCSEREEALEAKISVGDLIKKGQIIADNLENNSPVHAPVSSQVIDIVRHPNSIFDNKEVDTIVLKPSQDKSEESVLIETNHKLHTKELIKLSAQEIRDVHSVLASSGIVGMGGAGFSTIKKIEISYQQRIHTVIINLCECEPIISCDQSLTEQYAVEILLGIVYLLNCIQAKEAIIVVEDSKNKAIEQLQCNLVDYPFISLNIVPSVYPSGHENQLVQYVSGDKLVAGSRPTDYGYVIFNVATCYTLYKVGYDKEALIQRLITISDGQRQINQWVFIGTPIIELLQQHHFIYNRDKHHLIMGGPMNGRGLSSQDIGVSKNMNCLLVLPKSTEQSMDHNDQTNQSHMPCIRCGECVEVCPVALLPQQLYWFAQAEQHQKAEQYHLFECIECGNCSFVCPSKIPLVEYYRIQKKQISERKLEQYQIQKAKERFEKRNHRLERDKKRHQEMLHKRRQQNLALRQAKKESEEKDKQSVTGNSGSEPSQAVAIARAKAMARKKQKAQENSSS